MRKFNKSLVSFAFLHKLPWDLFCILEKKMLDTGQMLFQKHNISNFNITSSSLIHVQQTPITFFLEGGGIFSTN